MSDSEGSRNRPQDKPLTVDALKVKLYDLIDGIEAGVACSAFHPSGEKIIYSLEGARVVREYLRARRLRERLLPSGILGEPAWDILLDLYAAGMEEREISVSSACIAAAVPPTTALRWLNKLIESRLVERTHDQSDARRVIVRLTPQGNRAIGEWVEAALLN